MLYLAYGSNLNIRQMAIRCPKAKPLGPVVVPNWKLVFRGVADIVPSTGSALHAGLWQITKQCEAALDRYEGVGSGMYRKEKIDVHVGNKKLTALVYLMNSDRYAIPSPYYFDVIREGFEHFGLDEASLLTARGEVEAKLRPKRQEWDWPEGQLTKRLAKKTRERARA